MNFRKGKSKKVGLPPGSLIHTGDRKTEKIGIQIYDYSPAEVSCVTLENLSDLSPHPGGDIVRWINITGLHDPDVFTALQQRFGLHPLILEDMMNTDHEPKMEIFPDVLFLIFKMIGSNKENITQEQVSFVLGSHCVISIQERSTGLFNPIRDRLESNSGRLRKGQSDYLLYAMLDVIVDNYYLILEDLADELESLEEDIYESYERGDVRRMHQFKKHLSMFRKSIRPIRELCIGILKEHPQLIGEDGMPCFRDLNDHVREIANKVANYRETVSEIAELFLSMASYRMNDVMKALTIIATIFIPLSFLAGVYGMNIDWIPELHLKAGYLIFGGVVISLIAVMIIFFKKKKWL